MDQTNSVASRFVSQASLDEAKAQREADWKAAYERIGQEPPPKPEDTEPYDGRSLWEKLKEQKDKKQETFDEQLKFKNQFRALDEDEISFLDSLVDENNEEEEARQKQIKDELAGFRQAVSSRSIAPPPASIPTLSSTSPSPSAISPPLASASSKPAPAPPKKALSKKKDFQKKFLAGVIVKKPSAAPAGVKRSASGSEEKKVEEKAGEKVEKEEDGGEKKKRKIEEGEKEKEET